MAERRVELIAARNEAKMTQEEVAQAAGISRPYYVHIENGNRSPSLSVALRLEAVLGRPVHELFRGLVVTKRNTA